MIPHPEIAPAANVGLFLAWVLTNHPDVRPGDVFDVAFANRNLSASEQWARLDGACKELQDQVSEIRHLLADADNLGDQAEHLEEVRS
jgi:hypothetical protein